MKHQWDEKHILFALACVACLQSAPSPAVTTIMQQKEIIIDSQWETTGRYINEFLTESPQDGEDAKLYLDHLAERPDKFQQLEMVVDLPDEKRRNWNAGDNSLPVGSTVYVAYSTSAVFPGFEGLFTDYFSIGQIRPVEHASYLIRFPEKLHFLYRTEQEGKKIEALQEADHFQWSASQVRRLDLMITTAGSWKQITDRYQTLYIKQYGKGLPPADIPDSLSAMDGCSAIQKVAAVLAFLKNDLAYRSLSQSEHSLIPNDPLTVKKREWGDCKDLSLLGVALLSGMGVDAFILLTGTPRDNRWVHQLPDPFIFSHALLGIGTGGETHYYDYQVPGREVAIERKSSLRINIPAPKERRQ